MNPVFPSPPTSSLVTCLMADRMAEAADIRRIAPVAVAEPESPHRFRRFLSTAVGKGTREARPAPLA